MLHFRINLCFIASCVRLSKHVNTLMPCHVIAHYFQIYEERIWKAVDAWNAQHFLVSRLRSGSQPYSCFFTFCGFLWVVKLFRQNREPVLEAIQPNEALHTSTYTFKCCCKMTSLINETDTTWMWVVTHHIEGFELIGMLWTHCVVEL